MGEVRLWETYAGDWEALADQLDAECHCGDLVDQIHFACLGKVGSDRLSLPIPLDDCAYLRTVIGDLGLESEFADVTE